MKSAIKHRKRVHDMKKNRPGSITLRITLWSALILIALELLTFLMFRFVSGSILEKTVRGYLLSSVNENTDKIKFYNADNAEGSEDTDNMRIRYRSGWLEIDDDFLDEINDVQSALYTSDGSMLYGKNPIARQMEDETFISSRIYKYKSAPDSNWYVYDRKLSGQGLGDLWIRGVVTLSSEEMQLHDIIRTAMFFVPVLLLAGIIGCWMIARQALYPVRRIEKTVSEITQGKDLNRRIEVTGIDRELYDLATAFNSMFDRLEHSFETEQQFTSDASHELRTPMAVIMAQTELALEKPRTQDQYRQALEVIRRQGRQMNTLIASMLDYTRLELRPENYPLSDLDYTELVNALADDMSLIKYKNIVLSAQIAEGVRIQGNDFLLERAIRNLIDNAYKYGKENGNILVKLCLTSENMAECHIIDDGPGIPQDEIEHIFDRFYRGSSYKSGRVPGSGLGLSIVLKIAEIHKGTIRAESSDKAGESGSTFILSIPVSNSPISNA